MCAQRDSRLFSSAELRDARPAWELADDADQIYAEVVFDLPLEQVYHYRVPGELREVIGPGRRVEVPFGRGNRPLVGYCVGLSREVPTTARLKELAAVLDREPLIDDRLLELTRWIAETYLCSWGQVLQAVIPAGVKKQSGTRTVTFYRLSDLGRQIPLDSLPGKQRAVLNVLREADVPLRVDAITAAADCGTSPVQTLVKKRLVIAERERSSVTVAAAPAREPERTIVLNSDQRKAIDTILGLVRSSRHQTVLLHGVTGSGKTEVYMQVISEVVSYGRQAIVLVPEISLTPQTIRRFSSRFRSIAVLHSHLTDAERHWHWQQIARGEVQVVIGARSAIFAPTPQLGIVVIDEEHETSFKQDSTPRYHAREVARERCRRENVPLLLGSATPTLESWRRAKERQDLLISLPQRVDDLPMPQVSIIDSRHDPALTQGGAIGRALRTAMQNALDDDGQVILFLNVRGYSPVVWCRTCGQSLRCPDCDVTLTWHRDREEVVCHVCDFAAKPPPACPNCMNASLSYIGIGTQRLEQEVQALFPDVPRLRMDSDAMKRRGSHDEAFTAFSRGDVRILLGTQMIAKGLDFPNVTLVGVIDADTVLRQPDLRSSERTFQLIAQVAGRTGRSRRGGQVLVQTASPQEPAIVLAAKHDYVTFAGEELRTRHEGLAPPFARLARIIVRAETLRETEDYAAHIGERLREQTEVKQGRVRVLGPSACPIAKLKKMFRYHLLLKAVDADRIRAVWRAAEQQLAPPGEVEFTMDVDPISMR